MIDVLTQLLGLQTQAKDLAFGQIAARTVVVFVAAIALARIADRRFLGRSACFDFMLGVILGSVLSRGINGQAPFFASLGASLLLVVLHRLVAMAAFRWHWFSDLVKGREQILIWRGKVDLRALRRFDITMDDLLENLRIHGNLADAADVDEARLERNGTISVVRRSGP